MRSQIPVPGTKSPSSVVYTRGNYILEGVIRDLRYQNGGPFVNPSHVVVSGGSAGGLATFLHVHQFREALPIGKVKMAAIVDGGFFPEYPRKSLLRTECKKTFAQKMKKIYHLTQAMAGLPQACIAAQGKTGKNTFHRCMFASNVIRTVPVPLFVINSKYDLVHILHIIGYSLQETGQDKVREVNAYGANITSQVLQAVRKHQKKGGIFRQSGAFLDSCERHTTGTDVDYANVNVGGTAVNEALFHWTKQVFGSSSNNGSGGGTGRKFWVSDAPYPCSTGCCRKGKDSEGRSHG